MSEIPWEFPVAAFFSDAEPKAVNLNHGDILGRSDEPEPDWNEVAAECVNRIKPPERYRKELFTAILIGLHARVDSVGGWKNFALKVKPSSTESTPVPEDPREVENRKLKEKVAALERAAETLKETQGPAQEELEELKQKGTGSTPAPAKKAVSTPPKESTK